MYAVVKRNSQIEAFKIEKLRTPSGNFCSKDKQYTEEILELLALRVTANFEHKIRNDASMLKIFRIVSKKYYRNVDTPMLLKLISFIAVKGKNCVI